ncbi:hypothetical protein ABIC89_000855 [Variovorax boronicumulans]|uniref:hypothetical protein n=1 Tax=Variovorax boronicumulans TaxID=436515 RepID=UPI00339A13DE
MLEFIGTWLAKLGIGAAAGVGKVAGGSVARHGKQLLAERAAGQNPEGGAKLEHRAFVSALARLRKANVEDSFLSQQLIRVGSAIASPDYLRKPHIQDWLASEDVENWLFVAAAAKTVSSPTPVEEVEKLIGSYMLAAGEDRQHAASVVSAVISILCEATVGSVSDPSTAALVVIAKEELASGMSRGFAQLHSAIEALPGAAPDLTGSDAEVPPDSQTADQWRRALSKASAELLAWPSTLPNKEAIPRPELAQLAEGIKESSRSAVALLGAPGSGKSALLAKLGLALQDDPALTVLGVKADLLTDDIETEADLQRQLELPALPSVMLKALSRLGPVVLLIDQLDALASYLDVRTARLSVLLNLVRAVGNRDDVHIVVSCRQFEFDHDVRLRSINATNLTLALPKWSEILAVLERGGVQAGGWPQDAREVMRVPQHLNTYLLLATKGSSEPYATYQGMLDQLWSDRVLGEPDGVKRSQLVYAMANVMAEKEVLWLSPARFEEFQDQINVLIGAGVLTRNATGSLGFSHQTMFEYALARTFASEESSLSTYVLARQESLFVRPKLWTTLGYLRNTERTTYESEVSAIWRSPGLRKHLRYLLIDFLALQADPTDAEATLLAEAMRDVTERNLVLKGIVGSQGWFKRLAGGLIAESMSDPETADAAARVLSLAWKFDASRVLNLLDSHWLPEPTNDQRTLRVLVDAPAWTPEAIAIGCALFSRIDLVRFHLDYAISTIGVVDPNVAVQFLRLVLDRALAAVTAAPSVGQVREDLPKTRQEIESLLTQSNEWDSVPALAEAIPSKYLELMWPWYMAVFRALLEASEGRSRWLGYPLRWNVDYRFGEENSKLVPAPLIDALVVAIASLATERPTELRAWIQSQSHFELHPVQRLIAYAIASNSAVFAQDALSFLIGDGRRFHLGFISDARSTTKKLIQACAPHWSQTETEQFAEAVRAYAPARPEEWTTPDQIRGFSRIVRRTKVELLRCLPHAARSAQTSRQIEEGGRLFPEASPPDEVTGGWVGSPMSAEQFARASNDAIVNAFKELPDAAGWDHPRHFMKGGNVQLARAFAEFVKTDPIRAPHLISRLESSFGQRAAGYALDALAENGDPVMVQELSRKLDSLHFESDEFRASVTQAIERLVSRKVRIDDATVDMLEKWVAQAMASPAHAGDAVEEDSGTRDSGANDVETSNMFLLSGHRPATFLPSGDFSAISALVRSRLDRREWSDVVRILRAYLAVSGDRRIWQALVEFIIYLQPGDPDERPALLRDIFASVPTLAGTEGGALVLAYAHWYAPGVVMIELERWRVTPGTSAHRGYGELIALIALVNSPVPSVLDRLDNIAVDPALEEARAGAAMTAAQLWPNKQFRVKATDLLIRMLESNERSVWHAVFTVFSLIDGLHPEEQTIRLLRAISIKLADAPPPEETYVVERLATLLPHEASLVAEIAATLVRLWRDQLGDIRTAKAAVSGDLFNLAMTLHRIGPGTRNAGLQIFEYLLEIDAFQSREMLDEIDNRFREGAAPGRPRLRRKPRRQAIRTR